MIRKLIVPMLAAFGAGFLTVCFAATAYSVQVAYGPYSYFTVYTLSYKDRSFVEISPRVAAGTEAARNYQTNVATGWMAANARLYRTPNNFLCAYATWRFNDSPATSVYQYTSGNGCGTGYEYWSDGSTKFWNGDGYTGHDTLRSPSLNF